MKKLISILLCISMLMSFVPFAVSAAESTESTDGASLEELEKFGFSLDPDSYDTNALKPGTHPLDPKYDLYIDYGDRTKKSNAEQFITSQYTEYGTKVCDYSGITLGMEDAFTDSESTPYMATTGFSATGTGVDDHIAKIFFSNERRGGKILLSIYDAAGNALVTEYDTGGYVTTYEVRMTQLGTLVTSESIEMWEVEGLLSVTSGDFDGDGVDEIAVYTPNTATFNVAATLDVSIFEFDKNSNEVTKKQSIDLTAGENSNWQYTPKSTKGSYSKTTEARHYWLPYVALCGDDLSGDGISDLAAAVSFSTWFKSRAGTKTYSVADLIKPDTALASVLEAYEGTQGGNLVQTIKHRTMVTTGLTGGASDSNTENRFILRNANITTGDVTGNGSKQIIIAGNYTRASNNSTTSTSTATSNSYVEVDGESALCHIVGFTTYDNLKNCEMYNTNSDYHWTVQKEGNGWTYWFNEYHNDSGPITVSLCSYKHDGAGYPERIFVGGQLFKYNTQTGAIEFLSNYEKDEYMYDGSDGKRKKTDNVWIGKAVAGNLVSDVFGRELLAFPFYFKVIDEGLFNCKVFTTYQRATNIRNGNAEGSGYNEFYPFEDSSSEKLVSLTLLDGGNKTGYITYNGDDTDVYYTDIELLSIMQAPPLYEELNDDTYIGNSETSFTKSEGTGEEWTHGGSLTAGAVFGFEYKGSFLGIFPAAGGDYEFSLTGTIGGEDAKEKTYDYSMGFATTGTTDTAVIFAVPYVRYNCTMYVPEYKLPTESDYNMLCTFRDELISNLSKYVETGDEQASGTYVKGCPYYLFKYSSYVTESNAEDQQAVLYKVAEEISFIEEAIASFGKGGTGEWGGIVEGAVLPYHYCLPQQPMVTTIDARTYDALADATPGLEKIYDNVFPEGYRPGDPNTYAHSTSVLNATGSILQANVSMGGNASEGFLTNSNASAPGSVQSQSISVSESDSDTLTWGAAFENTSLAIVGGAKIGFTISAEYNGSHTTTTTKGNEYSGAVVALPANTPADYAYSWKLISYNAKLNGKKVPVVGYLTKVSAIAPPSVAQNISVENLTDTSATLTWENGERAADFYKILRVDADGNNPVPIADNIVPVDGKCSYNISNLKPSGVTPSTSYYVIESYNTSGKKSIASEIISVTTMPEGFAVAMSVEGIEKDVIYRDGKNLSAKLNISGNEGYDTFYQWQVSDGNDWVDLDGQTAKTMNFKISTLDNNKKVRCAVTMFIGSRSYKIYTAPITLHCARTVEGYSVDWAEDGNSVTITPEEGATPASVYLKAENANGITKVSASEAVREGVTFNISDVADDDITLYIWEDNLKPVTLPFVK